MYLFPSNYLVDSNTYNSSWKRINQTHHLGFIKGGLEIRYIKLIGKRVLYKGQDTTITIRLQSMMILTISP